MQPLEVYNATSSIVSNYIESHILLYKCAWISETTLAEDNVNIINIIDL